MRFALLGDHPDGLAMARALAATGRHALVVYAGPATALDVLARDGLAPRRVGDAEDALADPEVEAVIVAGRPRQRGQQVRRALQSERHVLCVHPIDPSADVGYEMSMLQTDVQRVLMPLLPEALHPGIRRLADLLRNAPPTEPVRLVECERWWPEECLLDGDDAEHKAGLAGWDVLRLLGGEIAEVFAMAKSEELMPSESLLLSGRFVEGTLWQATYFPRHSRPFWRLALTTVAGHAELVFADGWPGASRLSYRDEQGDPRHEVFEAVHPWVALVESFETALDDWRRRGPAHQPAGVELNNPGKQHPSWLDAIRAQELDDAVRRSVERRRAYSLDFQEATEEASFKGAMTLMGCSLLWISLMLLIFSVWLPWLGWLILPVFGVFLLMQFLGWAVPKNSAAPTQSNDSPAAS